MLNAEAHRAGAPLALTKVLTLLVASKSNKNPNNVYAEPGIK
jgi:hypothetical protein